MFNKNTIKKANNKSTIEQSNEIVPYKKSYTIFKLATICFLFAFVLYANTFKHSYVLDDYPILANNFVVTKGIQSIPTILKTTYWYGSNQPMNVYRPLSKVMFAIEWQISPDNPYLNHFFNVLFYALTCSLLFIVLRKYLNKVHILIPLVITLLYAAHPIHTEVVANIKSRDEIMSFFFLLLTLSFLHTWFVKNKWWSLLLSIFMYFLSFLSKEGVITMIAMFPIFGWFFTEAKPKTILISSLLLIVPAIAYLTIRYQIISNHNMPYVTPIIDNFLIGATDSASHFATAIMLLGKYLMLLLIPYQLVCDYSFNQIPIIGLSDPKFIISILIYLALVIYIILNLKKRKPFTFGLIFFLITISMYSNILFQISTSFGERLTFLPSLGICIALVFLIAQLLKVDIHNSMQPLVNILKSKPIFTSIFIVILIAFGIKTVVRAADWKDRNTLFSNDIIHSPNSANLCIWLGNTIFEKAEKETDKTKKDATLHQALSLFEKALSIYPKYFNCYGQMSLIYLELGDKQKAMSFADNAFKLDPTNVINLYNIGLFYYKSGNFKTAINYFDKLIDINPNHYAAHNYRGFSKYNLNDFNGAVDDYNIAIKLNPDYAEAYNNRGLAKNKLGDNEGASNDFNKAIKLGKENAEAYNNRGLINYSLKDFSGAIDDYTKAIKINPAYDNAYANRGAAKYYIKDFAGAIEDYNEAIKLNPTSDLYYNNRGQARYNTKDFAGAIDDYNTVIKINPASSAAYLNLGRILGESQKYEEAIVYFKKCIQYDPENIVAHQNISFAFQKLKKNADAKLWFDKAQALQQKKKQ